MTFNLLPAILLLSLTSCAFAPRFSGPKFSNSTGKLTVDPKAEVILALTNAKLDRAKRNGFDSKSRQIFETLKNYEGFIGGKVKVEILGDEVWTMTVWESEAALEKFVNSDQHLDAIYMTNNAMKRFRHLHIKVLAGDLPYSWDQAQQLLNSKEYKEHTPF